jgi:hypothetical protein
MVRLHRDITDRIRIIRRLDFTKQARIDATYDEPGKILKAVQRSEATKPRCCCAPTSGPARPRYARSRCTRFTWRVIGRAK